MAAHRKRGARSSFEHRLIQTRFIVYPREMALGRRGPYEMSPQALGIFMRLVPYFLSDAQESIEDVKRFSAYAAVSDRVMKKYWPEIEPYFDIDRNGRISLRKTSDWYCIQSVSSDRQPLRHLLDALVAFWGDQCVYCGASECDLQIEHIVPVVRGGSDDLTNLTLACQPCNAKKRTKTAEEFGHPHIHELAARIQ